jgi:hypothetical protein
MQHTGRFNHHEAPMTMRGGVSAFDFARGPIDVRSTQKKAQFSIVFAL